MSKPRIGITTSYNDGTQSVSHYYIRAIEKAGGLPVIVPMLDTEENARAFAALLDGLVMTGGPGITRGLVGKLPDDLAPVDAVRDKGDELIYKAMTERPMLGICYGMQFINAMHGGTIYGDLADHLPDAIGHSQPRGATPHAINLQPNTHLQNILQLDSVEVNTYHKQSLASVGEGLTVSALAPDGVIEGIENADGRIMGVQFHPERMDETMHNLFAEFVARCSNG